MKSFATTDFWKAYQGLSPELRKKAQKTYRIWQNNPFHPSLHFKKVGQNLWSARITGDYRALALKKGEDYYWVWVGTHAEYDRLTN